MLKNLYEEARISLTQQELNAILVTHERYLAYQQNGRRAMLTRANLDGLNLANRNLAEADFSGSSMVGANACGSNLNHANLYCADLRYCNLQSAQLEAADLRGASVAGARLAFAKLDCADLRAATMMYSVGRVKVISRDTPPPGVDFSNCSLKGASFGNAKLEGANFTGAILEGANFKNAKLVNVTFKNAVLTGVNLEQLDVPPSALEGAVVDVKPEAAAKLDTLKARIEAHELWITSGGKEGAPATLDGEDLRPLKAHFAGRQLAGLSARNTVAVGLDFSGSFLQAARFEGADLRDANFSGADLRGISLRAAKLAHAKFDKSNLGSLKLNSGTQLVPDLTGSDATSGQFFSAALEDELAKLGLVEPDIG